MAWCLLVESNIKPPLFDQHLVLYYIFSWEVKEHGIYLRNKVYYQNRFSQINGLYIMSRFEYILY